MNPFKNDSSQSLAQNMVFRPNSRPYYNSNFVQYVSTPIGRNFKIDSTFRKTVELPLVRRQLTDQAFHNVCLQSTDLQQLHKFRKGICKDLEKSFSIIKSQKRALEHVDACTPPKKFRRLENNVRIDSYVELNSVEDKKINFNLQKFSVQLASFRALGDMEAILNFFKKKNLTEQELIIDWTAQFRFHENDKEFFVKSFSFLCDKPFLFYHYQLILESGKTKSEKINLLNALINEHQ